MVTLRGGTAFSLAPENLLCFLCVHGAKHQWRRLIWVCDIAELIRAHPNLNWEHIVARASEFGMERRLYLGLFLAKCMLDAPLPRVIETKIHTNPHVRTPARQVMEKVFDGMEQTTRFPYLDRFTFQLRTMDRITDRSWYLLRFARGRTGI